MLFWRRSILPFLREFKIGFQLSGPHPKPIRKRRTFSLWNVGSFILLLLCVVSQSPLRTWAVELFCTREAGFLTSSIICKPIIDLCRLQVRVPSQSFLQTQVEGEINGKRINHIQIIRLFPSVPKAAQQKSFQTQGHLFTRSPISLCGSHRDQFINSSALLENTLHPAPLVNLFAKGNHILLFYIAAFKCKTSPKHALPTERQLHITNMTLMHLPH